MPPYKLPMHRITDSRSARDREREIRREIKDVDGGDIKRSSTAKENWQLVKRARKSAESVYK